MHIYANIHEAAPTFCSLLIAACYQLQAPLQGLGSNNSGSRSFGGIPRGRSPVPKASHNAGEDIENVQAPGSLARAEQLSYAQYGGHFGMPRVSPQAAAMAAITAASSNTYAPYNSAGPTVQRVRSQSPPVRGTTLQRARTPLSPRQQNSQSPMSAKKAQLPQPGLYMSTLNSFIGF
jgi:hypothetical protein